MNSSDACPYGLCLRRQPSLPPSLSPSNVGNIKVKRLRNTNYLRAPTSYLRSCWQWCHVGSTSFCRDLVFCRDYKLYGRGWRGLGLNTKVTQPVGSFVRLLRIKTKSRTGECWGHMMGICSLWRPISGTITTLIFCLFRWKMVKVLPHWSQTRGGVDMMAPGQYLGKLGPLSGILFFWLVGGVELVVIWFVGEKYSLLCKLSLQVKINSCD